MRQLVVEVIGPEYVTWTTIEPGTSFEGDLEMESLEFVALAERLQGLYGDSLDFVGWLSTLELDQIIALTVGDLVAFIASSDGRT